MKKKKKILIVEDDRPLVKIILRTLNSGKFDIILAGESDEAIKKALVEKPDLIVLDILLPGKDGFNCLKELKQQPRLKNIPVMILSNLGQQEEIRRGLELGAVDYMIKADFSVSQIADKLAKYLK